MEVCFLGIGSNLGHRKRNIELAIEKIRSLKKTRLLRIAPIMETLPEGGPKGQRKYLNTAVKIKTALKPLDLLKELKQIEGVLGRKRGLRFGPRVIDLDILLYGKQTINTKRLKIPHPRMFSRRFVLEPLSKII
ncbi:MAG: 2-amino-4-hydroxy-6-hydroxymethyldihydropteridine diphosphokinase [Candidatus Omnitrophica bacterium]|nr:2-amino-4-hydroxy-6-hydroxymethyldihydropteridine diphosphokinase [Candidatus Omnitrophota bacterium]